MLGNKLQSSIYKSTKSLSIRLFKQNPPLVILQEYATASLLFAQPQNPSPDTKKKYLYLFENGRILIETLVGFFFLRNTSANSRRRCLK